MLDIDETLMMTKHQPALLLSSYGVRMFEAYVRKSFTDFATKNRLLRQLERALKDKVLVESDTADVVHKLQESGCWVFGVTARSVNNEPKRMGRRAYEDKTVVCQR